MTAAKRAPAPAPKKPATAAKKSAASAKKTTAAKRTVSVSKKAPAKKAVTKRPAVEAKRTATTTKKAAPKRPAPAAKRPAATARGTATAAKKSAAAPKKAAPKKVVATKKPAPAPPKRPTVGPYAKEAKFLDEQRALLLEERSIYSGQAVDLRAEADSLALEREPGDVQFDEESGEGGTVTVDRERNLALSAQASAAVEEIDDALRKIERKTYGGCERCYQAIPKARLRALPFARLCVACKSGGLSRR
ncbi:MAG: TraR/DksA family transcriptional regulator [Acidimicrobiales bacterium]